jgi:hypothetical protein
MTGVPTASASIKGGPKPSAKDGEFNSGCSRYNFGSQARALQKLVLDTHKHQAGPILAERSADRTVGHPGGRESTDTID